MTDAMEEALHAQFTSRGVYLPLYNDVIFCGTCHNPHQEGVIQRKEAVAGAGERYFLRLNGGKELCLVCHHDKRIKKQKERKVQKTQIPRLPDQEDIVQHKPLSEQRCKACHAITAEKRDAPEALFLCFREGCHKTNLLTKDGDLLCSTCHPLIRDKNGKTLEKNHNEFFYPFVTTLALPAEKECSFCHSPKHKRELYQISTELCSECHLYLRQTVSQNTHLEFKEKTCSACHVRICSIIVSAVFSI